MGSEFSVSIWNNRVPLARHSIRATQEIFLHRCRYYFSTLNNKFFILKPVWTKRGKNGMCIKMVIPGKNMMCVYVIKMQIWQYSIRLMQVFRQNLPEIKRWYQQFGENINLLFLIPMKPSRLFKIKLMSTLYRSLLWLQLQNFEAQQTLQNHGRHLFNIEWILLCATVVSS